MTRDVRLSIVYYSSTGTVHRIATEMSEAAGACGAEVRLRRVPELAPDSAVRSRPAWAEHLRRTASIPFASPSDVEWADAVLFGTPTRFGNMAAQLKQFLDGLGPLWARGLLADKAYGAFTSGGTAHGGMETTLVSMHNMVCHFGGVVVPPANTDPEVVAAGNPYGTSHVLGVDGPQVGERTLGSARAQARRLVRVAAALRDTRQDVAVTADAG